MPNPHKWDIEVFCYFTSHRTTFLHLKSVLSHLVLLFAKLNMRLSSFNKSWLCRRHNVANIERFFLDFSMIFNKTANTMCFTKEAKWETQRWWEKYKRLSPQRNRSFSSPRQKDWITQESVLRRLAGSLWSATPGRPSCPASPFLLQPPPGTSCGTHSPSPAAGQRGEAVKPRRDCV